MNDIVLTQTVNAFVAAHLSSALITTWLSGGYLHFGEIGDGVFPIEVPVEVMDELREVAVIWVEVNKAPAEFTDVLFDQLIVAWCASTPMSVAS